MGKESITYHFLRTNADRICALLTPYNIAWTALVLLLLYLQRRGRTGLKNLKVSLPDEAHVLLGHAKFFDVDFLQVFGRICVGGADMYGLSSFFILHNLTVCVMKAEHVQDVLLASSYRSKIPILDKHFDVILGKKSLTQLMGDEWKFHRRLMAKSFHYQHLIHMTADMNKMGDRFVAALMAPLTNTDKESHIINMSIACKAVTLDIIGITVFGYEFHSIENSLENSPIAKAIDFLLLELTRRQFGNPLSVQNYFYSYPCESNTKFKEARKIIEDTLNSLISNKQREHHLNTLPQQEQKDRTRKEEKHEQHHDILRYLLESYAEDGEEVSPGLLMDNLVMLLFGGYDSTSITLTYLLYCLAQHPHVQARALAEVQAVLGQDASISPSYEQLTKELVYCTAVVEEVLRLYPPVPLTVRHLQTDVTLKRTSERTWGHPDKEPVTLPAGTAVYLPIWFIQRSELNFHDPLTFDPERFMPENKKHMHRYAFLAFSGGARDCVGHRFAMLELLSLFVNLIRKLKFECVEGYVLEPETVGTVQRPKGGLPLIVSKR